MEMYDSIRNAKDYKIINISRGEIEYKNQIPRENSSWKKLFILIPIMILYFIFILFVVEYEIELLKFLIQCGFVSFLPLFIFLLILFRVRFRVCISSSKVSFHHSKFFRFYTKTYNKNQVKSIMLVEDSRLNREGKHIKDIRIIMEFFKSKYEELMNFKVAQEDYDREYFEKIKNDFDDIIGCR